MSETPTLLYLEADDEITTVVRRMRAAEPGRVVIVAPGRSRATSSTVALRLLARAAESDARPLAIVGDALTRSLAAEAGIAAYTSVSDARAADPDAPVEPPTAESRTAAIHVVRGDIADDTAPTLAAVAAASREADTVVVPASQPRTQPPPPAGNRRRPPARGRRPSPRRLPPAAIGGIVVAVLFAWGAIAAILLPAAAVTITPRTVAIGPTDILLSVTDVEHVVGSVDDVATVTATGTYAVNEPARGRVTFFNFNFFDVTVPAGALVATGDQPGDQAFETLEAVGVPAGTFDPFQGGIAAGEASVDVQASAPGPDGNVAAGAIDTVLDPNLAGQLRGFPTIPEPLVTNGEPTAGGEIGEGVEITEEDVRQAANALTDALWAAVEAEFAAGSDIFADLEPLAEPQIEGLDDLVGQRDTETAEIRGSLTYDRLSAAREDVEALAVARLREDVDLVPPGWELVAESARVEIGLVDRVGDALTVEVTVSGERVPLIERDAILDRIIGRTEEDAKAAVADLGDATVELWPVWVGTVPDREWRIELEILEP